MAFKKERVSSFIDRGNKLIVAGNTAKAMKLVEYGLKHYTNKIINAISPYAKADAGLIVLVLRYLSDEVKKGNPGARELYEGMKKCVSAPSLVENEKIQNANRK